MKIFNGRNRTRIQTAFMLLLMAGVLLVSCSSGDGGRGDGANTPAELSVAADAPFVLEGLEGVEEVAALTGPDSAKDVMAKTSTDR